MSEIYKTKKEISKPCYLTQELMRELDEIFLEIKQAFDAKVEELLDVYVENELRVRTYLSEDEEEQRELRERARKLYYTKYAIEVDYKNRTKIYNSLTELSLDMSLTEPPTSVKATLQIHLAEQGVQRVEFSFADGVFDRTTLEVTKGVFDNKVLFEKFKPWLKTIEPSFIEKNWREHKWLGLLVLVSFFWIYYKSLEATKITKITPTKLGVEIQKVLKDGVNKKNFYRATELNLRASSGEPVNEKKTTSSKKADKKTVILTIIAMILVALGPSRSFVVLDDRPYCYKIRKGFNKIVFVTVPFFLLGKLAEFIYTKFMNL